MTYLPALLTKLYISYYFSYPISEAKYLTNKTFPNTKY